MLQKYYLTIYQKKMFVIVFTVLVLTGFTVTVGEENTCDMRDLKTLFVKMLTTERSINAKIEENTNAFLTELKVIKQHVTQQDIDINSLKANYVETIKQINETVQTTENKETKDRLDEIVQNMTVLAAKLDGFLAATDGGWSFWSNWTECSVTCGYGLIKRTRKCNNPELSALDRGCVGNDEEVTICNALKCPDCTISSCTKVPTYSGIYDIYPGDKCNKMNVYCDQATDDGGWIVIQRRKDGSVDFERNWTDYKSGFGDLNGEFWFGNDNIYTLTAAGFNELRIDMIDFGGNRAYAKYSNFSIKSESDKYTLTVSGFSGDDGDSLTHHNGMAFSTKDRDNDLWNGNNCAVTFKGAWWYKSCHYSNLNGYYYGYNSSSGAAITWYGGSPSSKNLKFVEMKIR